MNKIPLKPIAVLAGCLLVVAVLGRISCRSESPTMHGTMPEDHAKALTWTGNRIVESFNEGRIESFWLLLPEQWRKDISECVTVPARRIDPKTWKSIASLGKKIASVVREKKDLIIAAMNKTDLDMFSDLSGEELDTLADFLDAAPQVFNQARLRDGNLDSVFAKHEFNKFAAVIFSRYQRLFKLDQVRPDDDDPNALFFKWQEAGENFRDSDERRTHRASIPFVQIGDRLVPEYWAENWGDFLDNFSHAIFVDGKGMDKDLFMNLRSAIAAVEQELPNIRAAKTDAQFTDAINVAIKSFFRVLDPEGEAQKEAMRKGLLGKYIVQSIHSTNLERECFGKSAIWPSKGRWESSTKYFQTLSQRNLLDNISNLESVQWCCMASSGTYDDNLPFLWTPNLEIDDADLSAPFNPERPVSWSGKVRGSDPVVLVRFGGMKQIIPKKFLTDAVFFGEAAPINPNTVQVLRPEN